MTVDRRWWGVSLGLAVACAVAGWLGLQIPAANGMATLVWPPTGLAFAALWCGGLRLVPGVVLGAFIVNMINPGHVGFALVAALGSALPAVVASLALRHWRAGRPLFDGVAGLAGFLLVAVAMAPSLSAAVGTLASVLIMGAPVEGAVRLWLSWWVGDSIGVLLLAPTLILVTATGAMRLLRQRGWETLFVAIISALFLVIMSMDWALWVKELGRLGVFGIILWAALRLGMLGTSLITLTICVVLTILNVRGIAPFTTLENPARFAPLLTGFTILTVAGLSLSTVTAMLRRVVVAEREARHQAEQALARLCQTQDTLIQAEKMASLGRLVAGIAHEVATPVGTALSAATRLATETRGIEQSLADGTLRREQMNDYIDATAMAARILQSNMERAARLIESFKHVAVDRTRQDRRRFDLAGYLEEVVISLRPQTRKTKHSIALTGATRLAVDTYPDAVAQLVTNLLLNAVTHAFPDGKAGRVEVDLRGDELGGVELRIRDNGQGIDADLCSRVFEPFFTTHRDRGGSGLGLYMAYTQVTRRLGGTLSVVSAPGEGTCFTARFPAIAPPLADVPAEPVLAPPINLAEKRRSA